eukprot:TRINITY_DN11163_c0_g2_i2.p1 TRINITY_DN11163_c0_g2~~TRINITY_DN11163_c0_g2_i2.p1  ORF type:complete len:189 (+),score=44.32 TRINITY_DN11163_c0_g2_i2:111-677(+)
MTRFKVVMVGDVGVGRSGLMTRFCQNSFVETHGIDSRAKKLTVDGEEVLFHVWNRAPDTYNIGGSQSFPRTNAALLVYDITSRQSFENLPKWFEVEHYASSLLNPVLVAVVGNKRDLSASREVEECEGRDFAMMRGMSFWETSAKTGENVETVFVSIAKLLLAPLEVEDNKINESDQGSQGLRLCSCS